MNKKSKLKQAFQHIYNEIGIGNIKRSFSKGDFEVMQKAHDSIHEFMLLAHHSVPSDSRKWHSRGAFMSNYQYPAFYQFHRSLLEALTGYYNAGYTLLRNSFELVSKGAFWECLAHKEFRDNAEIIKACKIKIGESKKSILDWLADVIQSKPSLEEELERDSVTIFDKISPTFHSPDFLTLEKISQPPFSKVIEQLKEWNIFEPIADPEEEIYRGIYKDLSKDVHVIPDRTDVGRRILHLENWLEVKVIPEELNKYAKSLHKIIDVAIVIELNVLKDWIIKDEDVRKALGERVEPVRNLGLKYTEKRLTSLIT